MDLRVIHIGSDQLLVLWKCTDFVLSHQLLLFLAVVVDYVVHKFKFPAFRRSVEPWVFSSELTLLVLL